MPTMPNSPSFAILTFGCKVNQYESEAIAEVLESAGLTERRPQDICDLYIVNTCTVTAESDRKARQAIRRIIGKNPAAIVVVTGCSAQARAADIAAIPGVDAVVGNRQKLRAATLALELLSKGEKTTSPIVEVSSLEGAPFEPMAIEKFGRARAYVKIEDGCESRCAYCAIPAARGPIRSKPMDDVIAEVRALTEGGCREVVLTGIETGS
jgi:threonylcarbamoyladenosine tRNA methylthiotransferase MtaB